MVRQDGNITRGASNSGKVNSPVAEKDDEIVGGSAVEETSSAHEVMAVITPWTEPFLGYLLRNELPEDQTKA